MKNLIQKWRELSDKNFVDETLADSMEMGTCAINHRIKGEIYKQCADELEAALKAVEPAQLSHNSIKAEIRSALAQFAHDYPADFTKAAEDLCDKLRELSAV